MPTPDELTRTLRHTSLVLRAHTLRDLQRLWPALDWQRIDDTFPAWAQAVGLIVKRDRATSVGLAGLYLTAFRQASGVPGRVKVLAAAPVPEVQVTASLISTTLAPLKDAAKRGVLPTTAMRNAFVQSSGAATRLVLNGGRDTIFDTGKRDSATVGWSRETSGRPCAFCAMLASRGGVYYSEDSAGFEAHDHCSCIPVPLYDGDSTLPTGKAAAWARIYDEHAKGERDQLNAFRRAYQGH